MKTFIISVTARDIRLGQESGAMNCAIDRAIARRFEARRGCWGFNTGSVNNKNYRTATEKDSIQVCAFVSAHDAREKVKPFKFRVIGDSE